MGVGDPLGPAVSMSEEPSAAGPPLDQEEATDREGEDPAAAGDPCDGMRECVTRGVDRVIGETTGGAQMTLVGHQSKVKIVGDV